MITNYIPYTYKNAPIPGGGYVTGLLFHPSKENILYARTDIGGVYKYNYEKASWKSLMDHVTMLDLKESYPIAIAVDQNMPERLFIASGIESEEMGILSISNDYGTSFSTKKIPTCIHGNMNGRGVGNRLIVDPNNSNILYFASQKGGLLKTTNLGDTWERLDLIENYTTFVWVSNTSHTIVVGTAGVTTKIGKMRGKSLYISNDAGKTFQVMKQPDNFLIEGNRLSGYVASRYSFDNHYLYVTLNMNGRYSYIDDLGYSCDAGDAMAGKILKYPLRQDSFDEYTDITPIRQKEKYLEFGFGGVTTNLSAPGLVVCTTLYREKLGGEHIYISKDYGTTWSCILDGMEKNNVNFNTSYMKPENNGNDCIIHWMSDIKSNPYNMNELWFNTGTGVFRTTNLLENLPTFEDCSVGIEETVHLNAYAPVSGEVLLVDILGDLGGFAFRDLKVQCTNSFADENQNRYITCINADLSDENSDIAVIAARGNWKGITKGGLIYTKDNFKTFQRIEMPYGLSEAIDEQLRQIETPNVNPGWVAMSPSGKNIVWCVANQIRLPKDMVLVSNNYGKSFSTSTINTSSEYFKVYSNRINSSIFYGFDELGNIYVSQDSGITFHKIITENEISLPVTDFGFIDTANKTEIRVEGGKDGILYIALGGAGLWKIIINHDTMSYKANKITHKNDSCYRIGLGIQKNVKSYLSCEKVIYLCGVIENQYGFFRSLDDGSHFERINTKDEMFGDINSIEGDKRVFGRYFIATGSRGILYGEERN